MATRRTFLSRLPLIGGFFVAPAAVAHATSTGSRAYEGCRCTTVGHIEFTQWSPIIFGGDEHPETVELKLLRWMNDAMPRFAQTVLENEHYDEVVVWREHGSAPDLAENHVRRYRCTGFWSDPDADPDEREFLFSFGHEDVECGNAWAPYHWFGPGQNDRFHWIQDDVKPVTAGDLRVEGPTAPAPLWTKITDITV